MRGCSHGLTRRVCRKKPPHAATAARRPDRRGGRSGGGWGGGGRAEPPSSLPLSLIQRLTETARNRRGRPTEPLTGRVVLPRSSP